MWPKVTDVNTARSTSLNGPGDSSFGSYRAIPPSRKYAADGLLPSRHVLFTIMIGMIVPDARRDTSRMYTPVSPRRADHNARPCEAYMSSI